MSNKRSERPDAIIVTFSCNMIKGYPGGEDQIHMILAMIDNSTAMNWGQTISGIPTLPVELAYICFNGYIQYRMTILSFERNITREFYDGGIIRRFENKNWVNLVGPVVKSPKNKYPQRGFQGFRYTPFLF